LQAGNYRQFGPHDVGQQQAENHNTIQAGAAEQPIAQNRKTKVGDNRQYPEQELMLGENFCHAATRQAGGR
jgi:hypothetical protein